MNTLEDMRKQMDDLFREFWLKERNFMKGTDIEEPSIDIKNKKDKIEIKADLPGIDKKEIDVNVEPGRIEIKAKKKKEKEVKKKEFYKQERSVSGYYRSFTLPAIVDPAKAKSSFKNGVLTIILPKVKELPKKSKKLSIK